MRLTTRQKMTLARAVQRPIVRARALAGRGPVLSTRRSGVYWRLDLREGIDFSIWLRGRFEPEVVAAYQRLVDPGDIVLDIGANIGAHTLFLAAAVGPAGHVIAFEPVTLAVSRLRDNLALNPDLALLVDARQVMLTAHDDEQVPGTLAASWPLLPRSQLHATLPGRPLPTTGATACSLDTVAQELGPRVVSFVKLDVDGNEYDVLAGGRALLAGHRPAVLMELAPFAYDGTDRDVDDVIGLLDEAGYVIHKLRGGALTAEDVGRLRRAQASINVLAIARERAETWMS